MVTMVSIAAVVSMASMAVVATIASVVSIATIVAVVSIATIATVVSVVVIVFLINPSRTSALLSEPSRSNYSAYKRCAIVPRTRDCVKYNSTSQ